MVAMVDVGGYRLFANLDGDGPVVAWLTGIGEPWSSWSATLAQLGRPAARLVYDRGGVGAREPVPEPQRPRPYSHFAEELARLLVALNATEPVILVAHSFGCNIARVFARRYPTRVAGLVLAEPSMPYLALWPGDDSYRIDGDRADATHIDPDRGGDEVLSLEISAPAVVLTRTPGRWRSPQATEAVDRDWRAAHCRLAAELAAPHILAVNAGHQINYDAPELVAHAVDRVIDAVSGAPLVFEPVRVNAVGGQLTKCPHPDLERNDTPGS